VRISLPADPASEGEALISFSLLHDDDEDVKKAGAVEL